MNMNNFGVLRGRLVADPAVFANKDGSCKVKFTVAATNNYKNKTTGKYESQMIPVEGFTNNYAMSAFANIHKGDKVSLEYSLRQNNYEKNGQTVYNTVVFVENIQYEESKAVTTQRAAENAAKAAAAATAVAPAPVQA